MEGAAPRIDDYGLIGDGSSAALVSAAGSIDWCCMPRLDHSSCFARLLDPAAGHCSIRPAGPPTATRRAYEDDTMVLATTFETPSGTVELRDCFVAHDEDEDGDPDAVSPPHRPSRLLRVASVVSGAVELEVELAPRFDYGALVPRIRRHGPGVHSATGGDDGLVIVADERLRAGDHELGGRITLREGERLRLLLASTAPERVDRGPLERPGPAELDELLEQTAETWRGWARRLQFDGPDPGAVRRSALVLRALSHVRTGAVAAAATTSLPEGLGARGERNWDYRYSWVRDSTLAVRSLAAVGFEQEAEEFRRFIERSAAGNADELQVLFGLGGERRVPELELDELRGFRGARPVRVGNDAARQLQLDAYGMLLDGSWRQLRRGHAVDDDLWAFLHDLVEAAIERWREPDAGFWEARTPRRFTHSRALCWTAVDRGLRIAEAEGREMPERRWQRARAEIRAAVEERGYDRERGIFVRDFDSGELDAALLRLPSAGFCAWDDERMIRTTDAIATGLDFGGLLRRYVADDGFDVPEGAFLACSFWLAENYARQGRRELAEDAYERTMATANELGLFAEEYDPGAGEMLGNFPQALTHLSHLEAALALAGG